MFCVTELPHYRLYNEVRISKILIQLTYMYVKTKKNLNKRTYGVD